jgi:hypothetical protein
MKYGLDCFLCWGSSYKINTSLCTKRVYNVARAKTVPLSPSGEKRYSSYSFLTSALDGVSGQRHPRPRFTPGERTPSTHCTGGWVVPRVSLDTGAKVKTLFCLCRGSNLNHPVVQSIVRHYTNWATPVPYNVAGKLINIFRHFRNGAMIMIIIQSVNLKNSAMITIII